MNLQPLIQAPMVASPFLVVLSKTVSHLWTINSKDPLRSLLPGQTWRHLLTTGWSIFVSQKNLVSGDAVLFLRDGGGELRLGIRRAVRPRNGLPDSVLGNQNYQSVLSLVGNAVSTKSTFHVFYCPR
ncbi:auxin response factor 4-like [Camellia sinensis]|uniref:auxin response factor 4-like n=1 Tax=Camellia sinensis TaxID=4442 RepID=UPI0010369908|nr:auxin response factor 4-like [Camellia sinensis]